ncbi:MAG: acetyl-CoA carboxylase, carboxyltransferase subunit beta [Alphaproteobacteria bacterium]
MNWLTNFVRPKIRALVQKEDVPENLWTSCRGCEEMIFHRDLAANFFVCSRCGHHMRLGAIERLGMLFDDGKYQRVELPKTPLDPLKFRDRKRYTDRIKEARAATKSDDALIVAFGKMGGMDVVCGAFEFKFLGGSMGIAVGEGIVTAARLAVLQQAPLLMFPSSGGARMQEGLISLMQMPRTTIAIQEVKDAGLPYIVVLTDPTTGGVTASFAMLGDIAIAEPGAIIGFAGLRVIQDTIRENLPDDFQRAEYLLEHGMVDMVVNRFEMRETLTRILRLLLDRTPAADVVPIAGAEAGAAGNGPETGNIGTKD